MQSLVAKIVGAATSATHAAQLQQVVRPVLGGVETLGTPSAATGSITLDVSTASVFQFTPIGNVTALALSNVPAAGSVCTITLIVDQNATVRTIAAPTGTVKWMGVQPTQVASKSCMFTYMTTDGGTTWYASGIVQS